VSVSVAAPTLLRVATAGSVDDGKSTLIGRLLHDTKTLFEDQLAAVQRASERRGDGYVNLALVTDGLRAEREQGITIDVAYRYFATPARAFIVADTPGHVQYTRNMVTGASTSDVALVLVDARHGLTEQSRRHLFLSALLGVRHVVLAVNKMDLVAFDEDVFAGVVEEAAGYLGPVPAAPPVTAVPISALHGDNVVEPSDRTAWYHGSTLLGLLESIDVGPGPEPQLGARLHVQWVIRPMTDEHHDYRAYAGRLTGGPLRPGDPVLVLPARIDATVAAIDLFDRSVDVAHPGQSIAVRLVEHVDVSRGDALCAAGPGTVPPLVSQILVADVCWMSDRPLRSGTRYWIKQGTRTAKAVITQLNHVLDVNTQAPLADPDELRLNDLGTIRLMTGTPLVVDPYDLSRATGSFLLVDDGDNTTAAAGMIREVVS
jgi:sulfate adenylyltransferase subunit 1